MKYFGQFYLDQEKDIIVDLYREKEELSYILRTPNHNTGNLITNLAKLCHLPITFDEQGLKIIEGKVPCYINAYNQKLYIFRLGGTKTANIYPDGTIEMKASIPAISKTLMSQTKDYRLDISKTLIKTYILDDCKFRTDLHTHMNANLDPDVLIALGIRHQIRYPLYYIKKLGLRCSPAQEKMLEAQRAEVAKRFEGAPLTGKYLDRKINDNTFINFADFILNNAQNAAWNIPRIRTSLAVLKDGQAVFTNLEKVYLYRYVFTKGVPSEKKIRLQHLSSIPDPDIRAFLEQMLEDQKNPDYRSNSLFHNKLLWIARRYQRYGIRYAEISDTTLVKKGAAFDMLREVHEVMPKITAETGVLLRFLAAIRRIPLTIVKDNIPPQNYLQENLQVLRAVAVDPYVAGSDIVGEEINDIQEMKPMIREIVRIAGEDPTFVVRIHAGENDSLRDNVANSIRCVKEALAPGQKMPRMRIGHGLYTSNLRSQRGKQLIRDILENQVVLEFQITSNVRLNNLSSLDQHPLKSYLHAGIFCVQGTDGSALYGTDSIDEQLSLEKLLELTPDDLRRMRAAEEHVLSESRSAFRKKTQLLASLMDREAAEQSQSAGGTSHKQKPDEEADSEFCPELLSAVLEKRLAGTGPLGDSLLSYEEKFDSAEALKDQIVEMPTDRFPVIVAGGSFNNDQRTTRTRKSSCAVIDELLSKADPDKVFFVVGHKLSGYEGYLVEKNKGRFPIFAIVPTQITAAEKSRLISAGVHIRISIEASGMGLYKSFAYEIFKRRPSVLLAFDGNSAGANLIQEAKNGKKKCRIFVSRHSRMLSRKAESLQGYVTMFSEGENVVDQVLPYLPKM